MDVLAIGYLALLDRLSVDSLPRGDGDGAVGRRLAPSLTCDAPLVAMHLWEGGIAAAFAGSNPGTGRGDVLRFLHQRLSHVVIGPDLGTPFELEVTGSDAQRMWLNDPNPGVQSLANMSLPAELASDGDLVYVDSYPWLVDAAVAACSRLSIRDRILYVNLGQLSPDEFEPLARRWLSWWPADRIVIQVSIPALADLKEREVTLARLASTGAWYTIVTSGKGGLGVSDHSDHVWVAAPEVSEPIDTSGAGAAVAAALIRRVRLGDVHRLRQLGAELAAAGARQCTVDGGLPARATKEWLKQ